MHVLIPKYLEEIPTYQDQLSFQDCKKKIACILSPDKSSRIFLSLSPFNMRLKPSW